MSTDGGRTWKAVADKAGGMGCILSFLDTKTGWLGFGNKFQMTTDGGATWKDLALPQNVSKVAAISLRTPTDGYLVDDKGVLYITQDGGKTWASQSLGLDGSSIMGFVTQGFVNEVPQAAVRFFDADHGLVVLGLSGKTGMVALRTADGGKTWKEESLPDGMGTPYISRDGKFLTVNQSFGKLALFKYE
ncbi:MAG: hypothetical protein JXR49_19070 [Acidobacteria bacterium]|nr:hypothetical protein [Acidobacteriota bacterium]